MNLGGVLIRGGPGDRPKWGEIGQDVCDMFPARDPARDPHESLFK